MDFFGSTISGWQQNRWQRWRKENGRKVIGLYWQNNKFDVHLAILFISLPSLQPCDMKVPNFTRSLHMRWTQHKSCLFLFLHLNTVLSDSTWENFANICKIKWNWIRPIKFKTPWIHFLSDVFGLLSSKSFATMTTWRNDFSSLQRPFLK